MISKLKMQDKIQKDSHIKTLTFALTFYNPYNPTALQPPTDQTLYRTRPSTEFREVSIEHLRRVWHADRRRLLLRTSGPVPVGLAFVLLVETNPFSELVVFFRTMLFEYLSVLSRVCLLDVGVDDNDSV